MRASIKHLIKPAALGVSDAAALLREAGKVDLQKKAGYIPQQTDEPCYQTIEDYWLNSDYPDKPYAVRFVGRVVMQWFNGEIGHFNLNEPDAYEFADDHIFRLLDPDENHIGY